MPAPQKQVSPYRGMTMSKMVKSRLAPIPVGGINPNYVPLDAAESHRNYQIASGLRGLAHITNVKRMRVILPTDSHDDDGLRKNQMGREMEWYRQSAMPWGSNFMHTPTDAQRLNNPAQYSAVRQRQLVIPSTYGQFYAFMHALSAAFGTLQPQK